MTHQQTDTQKTSRTRPQYPDAAEVRHLLQRMKDNSHTVDDLARAAEILRKAGIRCDKIEE